MNATAQSIPLAKPARTQKTAWRDLRLLIPYLASYKGSISAGLFLLLLMGLVGALPPLLIGVIIDSISGAKSPLPNISGGYRALLNPVLRFYEPASRHALGIFCLLLVGAVAIKGIFSFASRWILIGISRDIEYDLRNNLLARLVEMEPEFYVRNRTGELMSRCTNDLNAVRMVLGPGIMYSANAIVSMVVAVALMVKLSPLLTLEVLIPVPVVAVAVRHFGKVIHELQQKIQAMLATLSAKVQENLAGVRVVRAYGQEDAEVRSFDDSNRQYVARNMQWIRAWSMFMPALQLLVGFSFLIVLWQGSRMVIQHHISMGSFIAFYTFAFILVWPMVALGFVTNIFQRGAASMGRLNYIFTARPTIQDAIPSVDGRERIRGEIEFRHLTFAYPTTRSGNRANPNPAEAREGANKPVLRDISLRIPAGSTVAIVGPTGSGKSTLAALVARLWEAPPGTIFLDGRPVRDWPLAMLRRAIGFVPQDAFLFSDTLRENIGFGVEDAPDGTIKEAARIASIYGDIQDFPAKFETLVGERGITLSGGQKQRTTLARALIRNAPILILDDAFSSVDTDTEEKILSGLGDVMQQRTTILISHRCSTVRHADQIVVLRDGQIVERGTHEELLAKGGYYAELYQKQLLEEELERT